jgi:hypothetical protein
MVGHIRGHAQVSPDSSRTDADRPLAHNEDSPARLTSREAVLSQHDQGTLHRLRGHAITLPQLADRRQTLPHAKHTQADLLLDVLGDTPIDRHPRHDSPLRLHLVDKVFSAYLVLEVALPAVNLRALLVKGSDLPHRSAAASGGPAEEPGVGVVVAGDCTAVAVRRSRRPWDCLYAPV